MILNHATPSTNVYSNVPVTSLTAASNFVPPSFTENAFTLLKPEREMECLFFHENEYLNGLNWGVPRFGHPEGKVVYHIREVLDNIDLLDVDDYTRQQLRTVTFVHDSFKHLEHRGTPRDWSKHHSALAADFLSSYVNDDALVEITRLHDEAFHAWRSVEVYNEKNIGYKRLDNLLSALGDSLQLFYLFFKCDTQTGDKIQTPVQWFENKISDIDIVQF